ncbi:MAG: serine hydrolase domain-containing protein [Candidatus Thorarchaeota archaeon SMTZ1-45]|nr:MAG: hypothetical protein AM325_08705 [Candidatus Thorarchaeota archaeon SMTZ1-45]
MRENRLRAESPKVSAIILMILILFVSNISFSNSITDSVYTAKPSSTVRNYWPTDGWRNTTPEEQGMDSTQLRNMVDYIDENSINIDSVIVIRHGYKVFEEYPTSNQNENSTPFWYSVTKSFVSCLFGIAIDKGYIDNVSQRVLSFFPNRSISNWDERKELITLEHLLTMHSGLFWEEGINSYDLIPSDGTQYVLELDMVSEPGEVFHYSSGVAHLLSSIIQQATGLTALEFAHEHLFSSLGITDVFWSSDAIGVTIGGFNLSISSRDAAKFGYLYLNNGTWDGKQIISHDWVKKSTSTFIQFNAESGYGYLWWTNPAQEYYYALGLYGQYIFVVPKQDLVVVFSSSIQQYVDYPHEGLLKSWILAAIQDDTSSASWFDPLWTTLLVTTGATFFVLALYLFHKTRRR